LSLIIVALDVLERELEHGQSYLVGDQVTLADFFILPALTSLSMTAEGQDKPKTRLRIGAWRSRIEAKPIATMV
jgi:glutathione S-transferase